MTLNQHLPYRGSATSSGYFTRRQVLVGAALGVGTLTGGALTGCSPATSADAHGIVRDRTLYIAGWQWGTPTNFNPLNPTAAFPAALDQMQILYEALFGFDIRDGSLKPHLAQSLAMPDRKAIVVKLRPTARWQDGRQVTADDVVYTFELAKRHREAPYSGFWQYVSEVTATGLHAVEFVLNPQQANPGVAKAFLSQVAILPKHLWTSYEAKSPSLVEFPNMQPVGSGPYKLLSADSIQLIFVRDDHYWGTSVHGKLPAPKWIVHPIFQDNAGGNLAFQHGEIDASQLFAPQIWKMWQNLRLPVVTWFDRPPYYLPGSIPMLVLNTTKKGLDDPRVRRALAHAIDYPRIAATVMSRYSDPAQSSLILPRGAEQQYFDAANVAANGWTHNPARAAALLQQTGAIKGGDGVYRLADGDRLGPWTVQTPSGWSDWQDAVQVVVENLTAAGVDVSAQFPQEPQVLTAVENGNFDLAVWHVAGASPATPWQRFRDVLDSRGVPPIGQSAFYNYGRFSDPHVAVPLDQAASATGAEAKRLFTQLDTIFMQNAPMIPLMYRPLDFFEVNRTVWTGFPTSASPTAPPMFRGDGVAWLYNLTPNPR